TADVHNDSVLVDHLEPPRLSVVATRCPACPVQDVVKIAYWLLGRWRRSVPREALAHAVGDGQLEPLQRVGVAARQPAALPFAAIGVEMLVTWGRSYGAAT